MAVVVYLDSCCLKRPFDDQRLTRVQLELFETVYMSLWKHFNAGSGAVLAGPRALLDGMYHTRCMFGGALWQAWPFALVARLFAEGFVERLSVTASS